MYGQFAWMAYSRCGRFVLEVSTPLNEQVIWGQHRWNFFTKSLNIVISVENGCGAFFKQVIGVGSGPLSLEGDRESSRESVPGGRGFVKSAQASLCAKAQLINASRR